jgi:histidinol dehydrogenase
MSVRIRIRRITPSDADYAERVEALARRRLDLPEDVERTVAEILRAVRERGDEAVKEYTERLDRRSPENGTYELSTERRDQIADATDPEVVESLERIAQRIRTFHNLQVPTVYDIDRGSIALKAVPLNRIGIYVPGGTARYPSSVLMCAIPARLAAVREIVMVTPGASPEVVAAAEIAGIDRVFEIGGAQAIAALAYGTETVPRVDKIVGPGNQWVAAAKRQVFGEVDIDSVAGPSEVVIVADDTAQPTWVAADLLAQAEHDQEARAILVSTSERLLAEVERELGRQLDGLPRREIATAALEANGALVLCAGKQEALELADRIAPEHLALCIDGAAEAAPKMRGAAAVFVGSFSPEAAGDYGAGPNHVLPTGGAARYASPLGVYDFVKYVSVLRMSRRALEEQATDIARLARAEGLEAHARSVEARFASRRMKTARIVDDE